MRPTLGCAFLLLAPILHDSTEADCCEESVSGVERESRGTSRDETLSGLSKFGYRALSHATARGSWPPAFCRRRKPQINEITRDAKRSNTMCVHPPNSAVTGEKKEGSPGLAERVD